MSTRRALHFVLKIADRNKSISFFRDTLKMKVLRHEEFTEQCKASCNGPYDGKWSKTMIGFGPEDNNFVIELTYNYGIDSYKLGNDLISITVNSRDAVNNAVSKNWPQRVEDGLTILSAPDGYSFVINDTHSNDCDAVTKVSLLSSDLKRSIKYWHEFLGMNIYEQHDNSVILGYDESQCKLELVDKGVAVDHAKAFGRIAFSCPEEELPLIEAKMKSEEQTILTPLVSLDTPGKATVQVVILADPDGHEICFVGDAAFRELSQLDPQADQLLNEAMAQDKSNEWFLKKGLSKQTV